MILGLCGCFKNERPRGWGPPARCLCRSFQNVRNLEDARDDASILNANFPLCLMCLKDALPFSFWNGTRKIVAIYSVSPRVVIKTETLTLSICVFEFKMRKEYSIGNCISYIGVSMLLQFQNNLLDVIKGEKPKSQGNEPNGITVNSAASAPGDLLARIAFQSNDRNTVLTHGCTNVHLRCSLLLPARNNLCRKRTNLRNGGWF